MLSCFSRVRLPALCDTMDHRLPGSSVHGFSRQEHWSGLPFLPLGDPPSPGIEPASVASPVSAGAFFTSSATRAARRHQDTVLAENGNNHDTDPQFFLPFPFLSVTPAPPLHGSEFKITRMKYWRRILCKQQCGSGPLWWKQPPIPRLACTGMEVPEW